MKLQRLVDTTKGPKGIIGENATYEWQTVGDAKDYQDAKEKVKSMDSAYSYRLMYPYGEAILVTP